MARPISNAPAPRAADGKPDLSGVWQGFGTLGGSPVQAEPDSAVPRAGFRERRPEHEGAAAADPP